MELGCNKAVGLPEHLVPVLGTGSGARIGVVWERLNTVLRIGARILPLPHSGFLPHSPLHFSPAPATRAHQDGDTQRQHSQNAA